jgi:hypothetical protein
MNTGRETPIMTVGQTVREVAIACLVLVLAVACAGPPPAQTYQTSSPAAPPPPGSGYEAPPVLKATDLAPAGLLSGPTFRVAPEVPTTGLLGEFAIQSNFGPLDPHGVDLLRIRVAEMAALEQLSKMSETAEFARAAGRAAVRPVEATVNMVTHPVDTITGMPASLDRLFDRVKMGGEAVVSAAAGTPGQSDLDRSKAVSERLGTVTINALGYEEERRHLAKKVNADPYTTNPILAKKLTDVAWVTFSARETVNLVSTVFNPYSLLLSTVSLTNNLIWDMKPADLLELNEKKMKAMGATDAQAAAMIKNPSYSITVLTHFVNGLERLGPIPGRPGVIALAATAAGQDQARFMTGSVLMLAAHHEWVAPLAEVLATGPVVGKTVGGAIVVVAPVDYVVWSAKAADFARRPEFAASSRDLWLTGKMSPRARGEFEKLGWRVHEGAHRTAAAY